MNPAGILVVAIGVTGIAALVRWVRNLERANGRTGSRHTYSDSNFSSDSGPDRSSGFYLLNPSSADHHNAHHPHSHHDHASTQPSDDSTAFGGGSFDSGGCDSGGGDGGGGGD